MAPHQAHDKNVEKIAHQGLRLNHDADRGRYGLWHGSTFIGFLGYSLEGDVATLQHTIINEEYGRQGYAPTLAFPLELCLNELTH